MEEIVNRVEKSGLVTFDLADLYTPGKRMQFDLAPHLWQGAILREKDFRELIKSHNWSEYQDALVAVNCSVDAIIPNWAYMLLATAIAPFAKKVFFGSLNELESHLWLEKIAAIKSEDYRDARIVVKGCGDISVPESAYLAIAEKFYPVVRTLMYGEPCSTVPVYKRPK